MNELYYSNTCLCGCGEKIEIRKSHKYDGIPKYINGHNKSNYKHGGKGAKLYEVWCSMKGRCFNNKDKAFKYYGGRGITICDEWLEFIPFRDWSLNNGYQEGLEIDRRNTNGNYNPENCRWITKLENIKNRRDYGKLYKNRMKIIFLYNSGYYTQKVLATQFGVSPRAISKIINNKKWG